MEISEDIWLSIKDFHLVDEPTKVSEKENWCCPECESAEAVEEINEEMICRTCGTVLETLILQGPEYRWFGSEDRNPDPSRCSCQLILFFPSLPSVQLYLSKPTTVVKCRR